MRDTESIGVQRGRVWYIQSWVQRSVLRFDERRAIWIGVWLAELTAVNGVDGELVERRTSSLDEIILLFIRWKTVLPVSFSRAFISAPNLINNRKISSIGGKSLFSSDMIGVFPALFSEFGSAFEESKRKTTAGSPNSVKKGQKRFNHQFRKPYAMNLNLEQIESLNLPHFELIIA